MGMDERQKAIDVAVSQIERMCGKGAIMRLGEGAQPVEIPVISTGCLSLDLALGIGGVARGRIVEIFRPGIFGKDHPGPAHHRRSPETGRTGSLRRCRTRPRYALRSQAGRHGGRPADQPARLRRTGPRDCRNSGAQQRHRRHRDRFGGGSGAQGGNRRRNGRPPCGPAGAG